MRFRYIQPGEGEGFLGPDALFPAAGLIDFLLQHGQDALDALPEGDEQIQALIDELLRAGLMERDDAGRLRLTPRMLRGVEHRALLEIFRDLKPGVRDGHASPHAGRTGERLESTRAYQFGDPLSEIDAPATLRNAVRRAATERPGAPALPITLDHRDVEVFQLEATADSALCVLLDLSGSMARYGRHLAAKKVALGLRALVRQRFPLDSVDFIGFASVARRLDPDELALVMPEPITTTAWNIRVRVPLDEASRTHPHFTNLHHALQLARQTLARRGAANQQIFIITDGQPTAHLSAAKDTGVQMLNLIYPPAQASAEATLQEALRCTQRGIRLASFALMEEYHDLEWVGFIEKLTRLTRGVAYYCAAQDLAGTIMESYLTGKRRRTTMGG